MPKPAPIPPERQALFDEIENRYIWGVVVDGEQTWPLLRELAAQYKVALRTLETHSSKGKWNERRANHRARLTIEANERTRKQWADMNRQVIDIHNRVAARITKLVNEDISLKERQVKRAQNEELVQRGLGNDDAVVPFGFRSQDLEALARTADHIEKMHARVMARAQALPLLAPAFDTDDVIEDEPESVGPREAALDEIYREMVSVELDAARRNGTLEVVEDAATRA